MNNEHSTQIIPKTLKDILLVAADVAKRDLQVGCIPYAYLLTHFAIELLEAGHTINNRVVRKNNLLNINMLQYNSSVKSVLFRSNIF